MLAGLCQPAAAASRVKDIADFEGVRTNMLVGYGLVVGLNGTGDSLRNSMFTQESLVAMLERLGVSTRGNALNTKNVAAVMVTATLPPFARQGSRIDVAVSALGDSKSLLGGTLLVTPLLGADGEAYAVAQGALSAGGFEAQGDAETVTRGVPTAARIPAGAIIEREVEFALDELTPGPAGAAQPRLHHRRADRRARSTTGWVPPAAARRGLGDGGAAGAGGVWRPGGTAAGRDRAARRRTRHRRPHPDRRAFGHHRHGRERPDQPRRRGAGQSDRAGHRDAAGLAAESTGRRPHRRGAAHQHRRSTTSRATAWWRSSPA